MAGINRCTSDPTLDYELQLLLGHSAVIAVDEVGRGALAGPVAVGAQLVTADLPQPPAGIRDSKLLSAARREALHPQVAAWGYGAVGMANARTVDEQGINRALGFAGVEALQQLLPHLPNTHDTVVLLDGKHDWLSSALPAHLQALFVVTKVGADRACTAVAAASIRAKVARDALMRASAQQYPGYGWETNMGYGSRAHLQALAELGLTPQHRASWIKATPDTLF